MAKFNKTIIVGNLTADPELKFTNSGLAVCNFNVAVSEKYKDKEEVCFVPVEAWRGLAENAAKYLSKGSLILVDGKLKQERWTTQDGNSRSKLKLSAIDIQFLNTRNNRA